MSIVAEMMLRRRGSDVGSQTFRADATTLLHANEFVAFNLLAIV